MGIYITIQSANRAEQVPLMNEALGDLMAVWYVPAAQADAYRNAGAVVRAVEGELPMKPRQLNAALEDGFIDGHTVVTLDDDYVKSARAVWTDGKVIAKRNTLPEMIIQLATETHETNYLLGGIAGTTNALWANPKPQTYGMIIGAILVHKPNPLRFDENFRILEDLEYILQHHQTYGGVHKNRDLLPEFHIFGRSATSDAKYYGGYKGYRTEERQIETLKQFEQKYPKLVFENQGLGKSVQRKIDFKNLAEGNL
jgi:hypothetical protein